MSTSTAREQPLEIIESQRPSAGDLQRELPPASIRGRLLSNRYLPETRIGSSPFGARYVAEDLARGEMVCIELLPRRALATWNEARAAVTRLAELGDPNIASPLGHGVAAGAWPFWVTEHGRTLRDELNACGTFDLARVARIGARCASALGAAHRAGVLHGALAPDRVLLGASSPLALARITGFGLAPVIEANGDALFGCPPELFCYLSPEHARGEPLEARSDIYSLGVILYELAVGAPPFTGNATAVLRQHRRAEPEPASARRGSREVAFRVFDKILARCLAKRPEQRYASAADLAADLARLDAALVRLQRSPSVPPPAPEPRSAPRATAAAIRRSASEFSPARRPPRALGGVPALPKVIVRGG